MSEAAPRSRPRHAAVHPRAFIDVFRVYNTAIWPAQVVAYLLGGTILLLLLRPTPWGRQSQPPSSG